MSTAKKMREISSKAMEIAKENAKRAEAASRERQKKLVKKAEELFPSILDRVLKEIETDARAGYTAHTMEVFEYDYNEHKLMAYEMVAKELATKKYGYRVDGPSPENGYNGEGNNDHDYYTIYRWKVSW